MTDLSNLQNFKGVKSVLETEALTLYRAVDVATGAARWVFHGRQPLASEATLPEAAVSHLRQFRHPNALPIVELGLDSKRRPFLVVEHASGVPLAAILADARRNETQLLRTFLQLLRVVVAANDAGICPAALDPALLFLANDGQIPNSESIVKTYAVLLSDELAAVLGIPATGEPELSGPVWLAAEFVRLAKQWLPERPSVPAELPLQPAGDAPATDAFLAWCEQAAASAGGITWLDLERKLLLLLAGRHLAVELSPVGLAIDHQLTVQSAEWQLLDCYPWEDSGWWRCLLYNAKLERWQLLLATQNGRPELKNTLAIAERFSPLPGVFNLHSSWTLGSRKAPWACLLGDYQYGRLLSAKLLPLTLTDACAIMAQVCEQVASLVTSGMVLEQVVPEQILMTDTGPVLLPIAPDTALPESPQYTEPHHVSGIAASLAALAVRLLTGQNPRWYQGEVQFGARFGAVPEQLRGFVQQCLHASGNRAPQLSQMATVFREAPSLPAQKHKANPKPKPVNRKREERKKFLLFLLLILLFQSLVNAGIIVIFQ